MNVAILYFSSMGPFVVSMEVENASVFLREACWHEEILLDEI